jgi:phenylalanyl-tRNA synthetase beta chain
VVDASNYVMLELGKPTHTFDAAAVRDHRLSVRLARAGERLETLDHVQRDLLPVDLVVADPDGPLAIAGIMGGATSEVSDRTTTVIIESAIFDPVSVRRTGQRYALRSEASLRFEKGQEFRLAGIGADRVAGLIATWAGATVAPGRADSAVLEPGPRRIAFRPARINRLLGTSLDPDEQRAILARAGIVTDVPSGPVTITIAAQTQPLTLAAGPDEALIAAIPSWRADIEIESDLAEEVARVHGYEEIPPVLPHTAMPHFLESPLGARDLVRETLAGAGLSEVVTPALVSPRLLETFPLSRQLPSTLAGDDPAGGRPIRASNPLSSEHAILRQELLGSLLEVVALNLHQGRDAVAIFEVGKGYGYEEASGQVHEWWRLGFALAGSTEPAAWNREPRAWDVDDGKGLVELLAARLGLAQPAWTAIHDPQVDAPAFHPGRSAGALSADGLTGRVGELHPALLDAQDLRVERVVIGEFALPGLAAGSPPVFRALPIARYPAVERDLAVVVPQTRTAGAVEHVIRTAGGELLRGLRLFDIYRGAPLAADEQSLNYRLLYQADDRTLTDAEIEATLAAITAALVREVGGRIRS